MKTTGRIRDIFMNGKKPVIVFEVDSAPDAKPDSDLVLDIEWKRHTKKRSLTANAYYWTLVGKIARALSTKGSQVTEAEIHNRILRDMSSPLIIGGSLIQAYVVDTPEAEQEVLEDSINHLKPTSNTKISKNGSVYRAYVLLRGSHDMDSYEFSRLVDKAVSEAESMDIETLTPYELARLRGYVASV